MIYYGYRNCSTCRKALGLLRQKGIAVEVREIRETPPSPRELGFALKMLHGDRKRLFNVAGAEYRSMGLKNRIDEMREDELFAMVQTCGNLCKRPFLIDETKGMVLVGFDAEIWERVLTGSPGSGS